MKRERERERERKERLEDVILNFDSYLKVFDENIPFKKYGQHELHVKVISKRYKLGSASAAIYDELFLKDLWDVLKAWGIGSRKSKLVSCSNFADFLKRKAEDIVEIDNINIKELGSNEDYYFEKIWSLIDSLEIVNNNAKLVSSTKALHHILPELIVPMDRKFTQAFLMLYNPEFQYEQKKVFKQAFKMFSEIALLADPLKYVGEGWHTSPTKVIDNALIGYCLSRGLQGEVMR